MRLRTNSIANGPDDRDLCAIWVGVITNDILLFFGAFPQNKVTVWSSINNGWSTIPSTQNRSPWCKVPRWVPCSLGKIGESSHLGNLGKIGLGKGGGFCLGVLVCFFSENSHKLNKQEEFKVTWVVWMEMNGFGWLLCRKISEWLLTLHKKCLHDWCPYLHAWYIALVKPANLSQCTLVTSKIYLASLLLDIDFVSFMLNDNSDMLWQHTVQFIAP